MDVRIITEKSTAGSAGTTLFVRVSENSTNKRTWYWRTVLSVYYFQEVPVVMMRSIRVTSHGVSVSTIRVASDDLSGVQIRHAKTVLGGTFSTAKTIRLSEMHALVTESISEIIGESIDSKLVN